MTLGQWTPAMVGVIFSPGHHFEILRVNRVPISLSNWRRFWKQGSKCCYICSIFKEGKWLFHNNNKRYENGLSGTLLFPISPSRLCSVDKKTLRNYFTMVSEILGVYSWLFDIHFKPVNQTLIHFCPIVHFLGKCLSFFWFRSINYRQKGLNKCFLCPLHERCFSNVWPDNYLLNKPIISPVYCIVLCWVLPFNRWYCQHLFWRFLSLMTLSFSWTSCHLWLFLPHYKVVINS